MTAIWKQTYSGRAFPMTGFTALDIDLYRDVAEGLARVCRFGGHVPGNPYSVAQHCVIGADAALEETRDANIAAYFLLSDANKFVLGDLVTPVVDWLDRIALEMHGPEAINLVPTILATAKERLNAAIWRAAGLPPPNNRQWRLVADFDVRLLATEQRQLLMPAPKSWGEAVDQAKPLRLRGRLTAWPVAKAAEEYRARLDKLCPNARRV
ncbi:hypothetical protein [Mesorhizobium sp.]|uniref:hypothetical protein n=1 Tax=Mesorhizobium sp. TaxID=1871066 RepID=UPI0011FC8131|nr:hypothetical protein [Mesorhizobium sp.]TIN84328.1 MAG: hypothetical protein E5X97_22405 [Mesorhizobium sp.]